MHQKRKQKARHLRIPADTVRKCGAFSQRDWEQLQYYMQHPEFFESVVERARAATRHVGTITEDDAICPERRQKVRR